MEVEDLEGAVSAVGAMEEEGAGEVREGSGVAVPVFTAPVVEAVVVLEGVGGHHRSNGEVAVRGSRQNSRQIFHKLEIWGRILGAPAEQAAGVKSFDAIPLVSAPPALLSRFFFFHFWLLWCLPPLFGQDFLFFHFRLSTDSTPLLYGFSTSHSA